MSPKREQEWDDQDCTVLCSHDFAEICTIHNSFLCCWTAKSGHFKSNNFPLKIFIQHKNPEIENIQMLQENA